MVFLGYSQRSDYRNGPGNSLSILSSAIPPAHLVMDGEEMKRRLVICIHAQKGKDLETQGLKKEEWKGERENENRKKKLCV